MKMTAANALTSLRLVLAPAFVWLFAAGEKRLALIAFCVASFTDLIDGTVARLTGEPTKGGALLDPIADKLLIESCFASLLFSGLLPAWFFALALCRDVMIVSGIIYLERTGAEFPYRAARSSKLATLLQMAVAVVGLIRWISPALAPWGIGLDRWHMASIASASALIAVSGAQYIIIGVGILKDRKASKV